MDLEFTIPRKRPFSNVCQLRITLCGTKPAVWRRILVPESYTFYDLHVAIQNAMGWTDSHLHCFEKREQGKGYRSPLLVIDCTYATEEYEREVPTLYDTESPIISIFKKEKDSITYVYDFGDNWEHDVVLEKILVKDSKQKYPVCVDGALACPPEDCGSIPGYYECIKATEGKGNKELAEWVGDWAPKYFVPRQIVFENPRKRFLETMID